MIKTNEHNVSFNDLTVDTAGLQALTHAGIKTATEIGVAAGAKIYVGRRVLWNVAKIRKYEVYRNEDGKQSGKRDFKCNQWNHKDIE